MNWCSRHPGYSAKRVPKSLCEKCWELWIIKCPEERLWPDKNDIKWAQEALKKESA